MVAVLTERRMITRTLLRCVPLTPLHVGDGRELRLDEYVLEDGPRPSLCRFDPIEAVRRMSSEERTRFRTALNGGRLADAAAALRAAGKRCVTGRVAISSASRDALRTALQDPTRLRTGGVHAFVRSRGLPYIPGSSIKGAFRTALASARLPRDQRPADGWTHDSAMEAALGVDPTDTSRDPLRFLGVADSALPDVVLLIDKAEVIKSGGVPASSSRFGRIQMHYERTRARSDAPNDPTAFDLALTIDSRSRFGRRELFQLTSQFHWSVWLGERERFFRDVPKTCAAMDRLLKQVPLRGGTTAAEAGLKGAPNYLLLRLGRFGHFESKSLDGVRRGQFPQARDPGRRVRQADEWGSTRTVTRLDDGTPIPFGWVLGWVTKEECA